MVGIYKITSPTDKIYIGQSINISQRKLDYMTKGRFKNQPKLFNSIQKYGFNNHKFEIIEECSEEILHEKEIYWKQYYLDLIGWKNVLFCQLVDGKGGKRSQETKDKISKANLGRIYSKEICNKISRSKKGCNIWSKGKTLSQDHINKLSSNSIGKNGKKILQYDLDNNFIQEWNSIAEIIKNNNMDRNQISKCCKNQRKNYKNYIFKFK